MPPRRSTLAAAGVLLLAVIVAFVERDENATCGVLRTILLAQMEQDRHRPMPKDFAYMPFELVDACGPASMRMPFPFKVQLPSVFETDKLQHDFFALKKESIQTRPINQLVDDAWLVERDLVNGLGPSASFTHSRAERQTLSAAKGCLTSGQCALFFDNSWTFSDVQPLIPDGLLDNVMQYSLFGNMFTTNLTRMRLTATAHSAPWYGSIAIQLAGVKEWLFYDPEVLGAAGVKFNELSIGNTMISKLMPFVGMSARLLEIDHYNVTTRPGELLYFPSHWTHVVYTLPGWNTMINLRTRFNLRTALKSMHAARKMGHSAAGVLKISLLHNMLLSFLPEVKRKALLTSSHDKATKDLKTKGAGADDFLAEFIRLNSGHL